MARTIATAVQVAIGRREGLQQRLDVLVGRFLAADHQTVADFQTPDAAAGAGVHELEALGAQLFAVADRIFEVRVAAIDDDIALGEQRHDLVDHVVGGLPRGNHDPDDTRRLQLLYQLRNTVSALGTFGDNLVGLGRGAVPGYHAMLIAQQTTYHIGAHAPQSNKPDFHDLAPNSILYNAAMLVLG